MERFNELNASLESPQAQRPAYGASRKLPAPIKRNHFNVDDTDSETEDNYQQVDSGWTGEWKLYMNTHEVVPDQMDIVRWWGVHMNIDLARLPLMLSGYSCMETATLLGVPSHAIISQLWLHLYQANAHSRQPESRSQSAGIALMGT